MDSVAVTSRANLFVIFISEDRTIDLLWLHTEKLKFDSINYSILKQSEVQSACAESTRKGVNQRWKGVTQTQQQRPESPTVTHLACV